MMQPLSTLWPHSLSFSVLFLIVILMSLSLGVPSSRTRNTRAGNSSGFEQSLRANAVHWLRSIVRRWLNFTQ